MLFRSLAIWLPLLGRIYPGKANLVPCVLRIEAGVRVAVRDSDDPAPESIHQACA